MTRIYILFSIFVLINASTLYSQGHYSFLQQEKPKYEYGLGVIHVNFADYPGSRNRRALTLPIPVFIYRGEHIMSDEEGMVRGRFFKNDFLELDISMSGSIPVSAERNQDRAGMKELTWMGELGPMLKLKFITPNAELPIRLYLNLPIRHAISTDFKDTYGQGFLFNPFLDFSYEFSFKKTLVAYSYLSALFATEKFHDYFYEVGESEKRENRPVYNASGGYFGMALGAGISLKATNNIWVFTGIRYNGYHGAASNGSPLHFKDSNWAFAFGMTFTFASDQKVILR